MAVDIRNNKVRNEEFKIWKKTIPSLYEHVSCLQPKLASDSEPLKQVARTVQFTDAISEDVGKGILRTSLHYSQQNKIYEIGVELPLGVYKGLNSKELPQPKYSEYFTEPDQHKWGFGDEIIVKLRPNRTGSSLIAMSNTGSLAWFTPGSKQPSAVAKIENIAGLRCDFDVSPDSKHVVRLESSREITHDSSVTYSVIDNADRVGTVLKTVSIPKTKLAKCVRFHSNTLFSTLSEDSALRFWDVRNSDEPVLTMISDKSGDPELEGEGKLSYVGTTKLSDTFFITGSNTGMIKLWDFRSLLSSNSKVVREAVELAHLYQVDNEPVVDIKISALNPECFVTVGAFGNVYHWDISYLITELESKTDSQESIALDQDDLQEQCLKFLHTGGGRRFAFKGKDDILIQNSVTQHPIIPDVIGTVDCDGFLTVYKGFYGRDEEPAESE